MRKITILLAALAAALFTTASAQAATHYNVRFGVGDQSLQMFAHPGFSDLKLRQVRYFIAWNAMDNRDQRLRARAYVKAARAAGARPFLHLSTDDLREKHGKLPSTKQYRRAVGRLVRYFRKLGVRDFGAWNEANHKSEPTWNHPEKAARYWKELRRAVSKTCSLKRCRAVGLDVLDQAGVERYIRRFIKGAGTSYARRYLRIVGIHNYSDVNRKRTSGLRSIIRTVHHYKRNAHFWLTETGGVVKFGRSFPCSQTRAAHRLDFLFATAKRFRHQIQRVYLYNWYGGDCQIRFDAGLVDRDGQPRKGFFAVKRGLRHFKR